MPAGSPPLGDLGIAGGDVIADVHRTIAEYYTHAVALHGATAQGVDWTCTATQALRFVHLLRVCDFTGRFSLTDVGCGYGALLDHLDARHPDADVVYCGVDLSPLMIRHARRRWRNRPRVRFRVASSSPEVADYTVASGIFNVKLDHPVEVWERVIAGTLADMRRNSRHGFAVNFLAPRPGGADGGGVLYRTRPERWIDYCSRELACVVAPLDGYGLREFTLLIRCATTSGS